MSCSEQAGCKSSSATWRPLVSARRSKSERRYISDSVRLLPPPTPHKRIPCAQRVGRVNRSDFTPHSGPFRRDPHQDIFQVTLGGTRVSKRRRPDHSSLGVPEWYDGKPPFPRDIPGTEAVPLPSFNIAHSTILPPIGNEEPWLALVLFNHGTHSAQNSVYHNKAKITGEVRLQLKQPKNLASIDVWLTIRPASVIDNQVLNIANIRATVWNRSQGNPATPGDKKPFRGKFPAGSYVFPFELPALPRSVRVQHPSPTVKKNKGRVFLPPSYTFRQVGVFSGHIEYRAGINVKREGMGSIDDELNFRLHYYPLHRPILRAPTSFPYFALREDWPLKREIIGGWTITPFGGRGRLGMGIVEIEGLLGIQEPAVYTGSQTLSFGLQLWANDALALDAFAQPGAIDVSFNRVDVYGFDALHPRSTVRKNRYVTRLTTGRAWLTDDGEPPADAPVLPVTLVDLPKSTAVTEGPASPTGDHPIVPPGGSYRIKGAAPSRFQEIVAAPIDEDDEAQTELSLDAEALVAAIPTDEARPSSPAPSLYSDDAPDPERTVRLDGTVRIPLNTPPSFRFENMAREYALSLAFAHPQYMHISPSGPGIFAETPLLLVVDHPGGGGIVPAAPAAGTPLEVRGPTLELPADAVRRPVTLGEYTTDARRLYLGA